VPRLASVAIVALAVLSVWRAPAHAQLATASPTVSAVVRPAPPALAARVTAFFSAWKDRDLAAMYPFYCRAYREKTPRVEYLKLSRLLRFPILEFMVRGIEAEAAPGTATVVIQLKNDTAPMPTGIVDSETRQVWLQEGDGTWCRESEVLLLPFPGGR